MGFDLYGLNPKIKEGTEKPTSIDWTTATEEEQKEYFEAVEKFEETNKGVYFRNNVWWWRRLADYVCDHTGVVNEKDKDKWQYNDGHKVSEEEAKQIANQLEHLIKTGHTQKHANQIHKRIKNAEVKNKKLDALLDELRKRVKEATGKNEIAPIDYPDNFKEEWEKLWKKKDNRANYPFSIGNVKEFIEFARNSGGFEIG